MSKSNEWEMRMKNIYTINKIKQKKERGIYTILNAKENDRGNFSVAVLVSFTYIPNSTPIHIVLYNCNENTERNKKRSTKERDRN